MLFRLKFKSYLYYSVISVFLPIILCSQTISQLKSRLISCSEKEKISIYLKIGDAFIEKYGEADSMILYSQQAYKKAEELNDNISIIKSLLSVGVGYSKKNKLDTSTFILTEVLSLAKKSKLQKTEGDACLNLGINYYRMNDEKLATSFFINAISVYQSVVDYEGQALANCKLAAVFIGQKQISQALYYTEKVKKLFPLVTNIFSRISLLSSLSGVYVQVAIQNKNYIDSSVVYGKAALSLANLNEYYSKGNQLCISISNAYSLKGDNILALDYCKQSMKYKKFLYPNEILISYSNFSDCYFRLNQYKLSLSYLDSFRIILKSSPDPFYEMALAERVHEYNKATQNYTASLAGLERYGDLRDSLFNIEKNKAVNELEQKFNKVQNEKEIDLLNQEKKIASLNIKVLIAIVLAAILGIIIIIFFYRQLALKNKFKTLEIEQRLNRARMDPHFFFNALTSIQTLSLDDENVKKVSSLIAKFSKIMRQSLESTYDELITIEEEVIFLTNYLDLQKLRYNNKFDYEIKVDDKLEQDELKVLGMLLQPFIENSIEHGFKNINYPGKINILFELQAKSLVIIVSDNGKGIIGNENRNKMHISRATQIIKDRIYLLNKQHNASAHYKITSTDTGTEVAIYLPVI